jgi:TPR repeat protein
LYKKAALGGYTDAIARLGLMCYKGEGGEKNYEYAVRMFRHLAENGDGDAQNLLGVFYRYGEGMARDYTQAVASFTKSADNENSADQDGQVNLARCHMNGWGVG